MRSTASILASVKEQEARFERLTRALEEERRTVSLQLERGTLPPTASGTQSLAWQQMVMQVTEPTRHPPSPHRCPSWPIPAPIMLGSPKSDGLLLHSCPCPSQLWLAVQVSLIIKDEFSSVL